MLSTGEFDYIKNLTINFYDRGYENYLCITNNPTSYTNNNVYDVICYYSMEEMSINNSHLVLPGDTQKCEFDSNSYSDNNTIDKLFCESTTGTVSLSTKEYVYSNLDNYSNIISDYELKDIFFKSSFLVFLSILSVIIIIFLYKFVSKILRR